MSHFTVLVIGPKTKEELAKVLAPYDENMKVDPYPAITLQSVAETKAKRIQECKQILATNNSEKYNLEAVAKHLAEYESTTIEQQYQKELDYHREDKADFDKDGNPLTQYNPNSKWDFYQIGGRFTGFFRLKEGCKGKIGEFSLVSERRAEKGTCDIARMGDIDWTGMKMEREANYRKYWQEMQEKLATCKTEEEKKKAKTDFYWAYGYEGEKTEKEFIKNNSSLNIFAVVKNGKWYEKGQMVWWAMVADEKEADVWDKEVAKLLSDVRNNTTLMLVDCHI